MTVSSTVVPVAPLQDSIVYSDDAAGVNAYQRLRETSGWQAATGGSPAVVAPRTSGVTLVREGNGPSPGTTSAPPQRSLAGGAAGPSMRTWYWVMGAPPPADTG